MGVIQDVGTDEPDSSEAVTGGESGGVARRRRALLYVVAAAVLLSGAGLASSLVIKSPAQLAAETAPPPPDVLTAPVERRVLTDSVVVRGRVTAGQSVDVTPAAPAGGGGRAVVTKLPVRPGSTVQPGQPLAEVAGRPVFALQGDLPVYRDLKPGATGQDVRQLQEALKALGFDSDGDPAGTYGPRTKEAVTGFYAAHGYDPVPAQPDGDDRLAAAEDAVTTGERALADARDALKAARQAADSPAGAAPPDGTGSGTGSGTGKQAAPGAGGVAAAQKQADRAAEDLAKLRTKLAAVRNAAGPMVPAGEVVYLSGFPGRVDAVSGRVGGDISGKLLTVSAGALVVKGSLAPTEKGLVHPGQTVSILSELTGLTATATVASVADTPGDDQQSGTGAAAGTGAGAGTGQQLSGNATGYQLVVQPGQPLDPRLAAQDVRLTIQAASSAGPVLVVPVSAVSATTDGRTVVTVYRDGRRRQVEVAPGTVGGGNVEVRPIGADSLKEGDQVIVGVKSRAGTS